MERRRQILIVLVAVIATMMVYGAAMGLTSSGTTYTAKAGASNNVPLGCSLAKTVSEQGYSLSVYLPGSPKLGTLVCMDAILTNVGNSPTSLPRAMNINITSTNGRVVFLAQCVPLSNGELQAGRYYECTATWNTASAYKGVVPVEGTYHVNMQAVLSASTISSTADVVLST